MNESFLTYFTKKTTEELNSVVFELYETLSNEISDFNKLRYTIVKLLVDKFDSSNLIFNYNICVSDKLEKSIKQTLKYAIDTEMLIIHIYRILEECKG